MQEGFPFKGNKLCVPAYPLRELLVREAHEGSLAGQFRLNKTLDILKNISNGLKWGKMFIELYPDAPFVTKLKDSSIKAYTLHFQFP